MTNAIRDYQADAIAELEYLIDASWRTDNRPSIGTKEAPLYVLPTGGGKTIILGAIIGRAVAAGKRVLVLTHRREILKQISFKVTANEVEHGLIQAGLNIDLEYPVQVASIQTLWARAMRTRRMELPPADLIIIDEAHHIAARTWRAIIEAYPNASLIGLTATPCRSDGHGLGNFFTRLVEGPQVAELIKLGFLVPTIVYAPVNPNLKGVKVSRGDYVVSQLADRMNRDDLVGDVVSNWLQFGQRRKTLVFCVDVAHSLHIRDEFIKAGVRAEHLDGSTPKSERDAILNRLASGETELVSNCQVLTEGFDLPAIGCIILARPTKQMGLFRQMAGRGLRPAPGKKNLILIDHSGAVFLHGLLEDHIEWSLDISKTATNPTHAARRHSGISRLVECSQCGAQRTGGEACGNCGFMPKRRPDPVIFREGQLGRVNPQTRTAEGRYGPEEKMRFLGQLTAIQQQRGRNPGWVYHSYLAKFGEKPLVYKINPILPTPEVLAWVRSRDIAYAKARAKERGE
jgi:DNA repair protein RadD